MSFFLTCFLSGLRTQLSRRRSWLLLLMLPLAGFGAGHLFSAEEVSAPVQVGVVLPGEGGAEFWSRLEARSGLAAVFRAAQREQAERQVAAGRWDCALVLPEDFKDRLARRELDGLFTLLIGPASAAYPLVRETAAACAAQCISPGIAEDYLLDSGIVEEQSVEAVRPRLQETLLERDRVLVTLETADGRPLDPIVLADRGTDRLLTGLTAILLLIWVLFTAMDLGQWMDSSFARRLIPLRGRTAAALPRLAGALCPAACSGVLALLAAEQPAGCILALIPYLGFWGALAMLLARCRGAWTALPVLMPFVPVLGLLLSPVLLDLSLLFPAAAPAVRWNPVTLYLRACSGAWADALLLAGAAALILGLSAALDLRGHRTQ